MMLDELLATISDDIKLSSITKELNPAVYGLIQDYKQVCNEVPGSILLTEEDSIGDLKSALNELPVEVKIDLFKKFIDQREKDHPKDSVKNTVLRSIWGDEVLRRWIVKTIVITAIVIFLLVIGSSITLGIITGKISDGALTNTLLNTAYEMLKLIFGAGD